MTGLNQNLAGTLELGVAFIPTGPLTQHRES